MNALAGFMELISGWGYRTETAPRRHGSVRRLAVEAPAIVVTDLKMPRLDGMGLLAKLSEGAEGLSSNMAVVVLTAMGSIQLAVDAMKLGAYDFLPKPVDATRLKTILSNATKQRVRRRSSWKSLGGSCGNRACWASWSAAPRPCAKFSR